MNGFTSQWTAMTFRNKDEQQMIVTHDNEDNDIMAIKIGNRGFWFEKENAKKIAEALIMISEN